MPLPRPAGQRQAKSKRFPLWEIMAGVILLALMVTTDLLLIRRYWGASTPPPTSTVTPPAPMPMPPPPPLRYGFPTGQEHLEETTSTAVYMPPASGKVESALYGSNRTALVGGRLVPRFHTGLDIAPWQRGRHGLPTDVVRAVADGRVAYLQRAGGGSNYGRYVLLHHEDPLGKFYSLYAHLEGFAPGLKVGDQLSRGQALGQLGHSASTPIPVARAHLHLELGVMINERFGEWLPARGYPRTHGAAHGWNLNGINPLRVLLERGSDGTRSMLEVLRTEPVAFTLLVETKRIPDYYRRHPMLWEMAGASPRRILVDVAEGGAPLRARPARPEDLGGAAPRVIFADAAVLGRNGRGLVTPKGAQWQLSTQGRQWLDQLLF